MLKDITPIILTFNEEENLARTLKQLSWADDVLLIDSGSTDDTLEIANLFGNTRVIHHPFESFAKQCNFALQQDIESDWVLSMDADYVLTDDLIDELTRLSPGPEIKGYQIGFQYLIDGQPLRGSLYPPRTCLYRLAAARYTQDGHAHRVVVEGAVGHLQAKIQHDDRKPNARWLKSQEKYAEQEAEKLRLTPWWELGLADKIRKTGLGPLLILPYTLLLKGVALDGKPGWAYAKQRYIAEHKIRSALFRKSGQPT